MTEQLLEGFRAMSGWEYVGVIFGMLYLVLAMKQSLWCWPAAFISTLVYTILFWQGALLMESALNVYYLLMAIYGYWQWRGNANAPKESDSFKTINDPNARTEEKIIRPGETTNSHSESNTKQIVSWSLPTHLVLIVLTSLFSICLGFLLEEYSHAKMAYLDSFTTCFAVVTTYLFTQKVLENWLYWVVIDLASIYLYIEMGYLPTAALFVVYTVLAIQGYRIWCKERRQENETLVQGSA